VPEIVDVLRHKHLYAANDALYVVVDAPPELLAAAVLSRAARVAATPDLMRLAHMHLPRRQIVSHLVLCGCCDVEIVRTTPAWVSDLLKAAEADVERQWGYAGSDAALAGYFVDAAYALLRRPRPP